MDFDKPIQELEGKIAELRNMIGNKDFNIAEEISRLEGKAEKLMRATYSKLPASQKVQVARHPERPHFKDYIMFFEYFHGDNGRGVGASHQTGWTSTVAKLIQPRLSSR